MNWKSFPECEGALMALRLRPTSPTKGTYCKFWVFTQKLVGDEMSKSNNSGINGQIEGQMED